MTSPQETVPETTNDPSQAARPFGYYALLIAIYQGLYGLFLLVYRRKHRRLEEVTPLDLVLLGLSTLRLAKTISEDEVTVVLRKPLVQVQEGQPQPKGHGLRLALGKLVLCSTCVGTWIAAFLGYGLHLFPSLVRPFLAIMSASAIEQVGDAVLSLVYTDRDAVRQREERQKS